MRLDDPLDLVLPRPNRDQRGAIVEDEMRLVIRASESLDGRTIVDTG